MEKQDRGVVGLGSAGTRLKSLYRKTQSYKTMSFKHFVREQGKDGNVDAREWRTNKSGVNSAKRDASKQAKIDAGRVARRQPKAKK